ncbi:MAG: mechanosensitive ion channel family protein [Pseudomonadota bacterium]
MLGHVFAVVAALVLWAAAALAQPTAEAPSEERVQGPTGSVSIDPQARDDDIAARIAEILRATGWYDDVRVEARDGVVFLDGTAQSTARVDWAQDLASKTETVVAVVNRIAVERKLVWDVTPAVREVESLARQAVAALPLIVLSLIVLPLAWLASRLAAGIARRALARRVEADFLRDVIARAVALPIFLIGLYFVLQIAGLTRLAVSIIGGAGVVGIVVGFAFRDIAENFLASVLLSVRQPFRRGDFIDVGGSMGTVHSMNTRSTVLISPDGNHVQIPNAAVFKSIIVNFTAAASRRAVLEVGIGYDASISDAQEVIRGVLAGHEAVLGDPPPMVLVDSLGDSTVNIKAYYWFDGAKYSVFKVTSALNRLTKGALMDAGISMPDAAREVVFPQGVPVIEAKAAETSAPSAPAPAAAGGAGPAQESKAQASAAEGGLKNESEDEAIRRLAAGASPEGRADLLGG